MIVTNEQIDALDACVKFCTMAQAHSGKQSDVMHQLQPPLPIRKAHDAMRRLRYYASLEKE